jgi:hypothetical protein
VQNVKASTTVQESLEEMCRRRCGAEEPCARRCPLEDLSSYRLRNRKRPVHKDKPKPLVKGIVMALWNLTKKYENALKDQEVFEIRESENDREEVSEAYQFVETPWEHELDGRCYLNMAKMQLQRDAVLAAIDVTPEVWISRFATEVKRRATPLVFLVSRESIAPEFTLPDGDNPLASGVSPTPDDRAGLARHKVAYDQLLQEELKDLCAQLAARLEGKQYSLDELAEILTNWELDLLSQMIRDGGISASFLGMSTIAFRPSKRKGDKVSFAAVAVQSRRRQEVQL